jgi:hypothetical protein
MQNQYYRMGLKEGILIFGTVSLISIHIQSDMNKCLIDHKTHNPEPHNEETAFSDHLKLNRDKVTAAASGVSSAIIFGEESFE